MLIILENFVSFLKKNIGNIFICITNQFDSYFNKNYNIYIDEPTYFFKDFEIHRGD